jgi:GNAT superfamily N-acetyltransferase
MSSDIKIIEKPNRISWDEIHEVLWESHAGNRQKGIIMAFPSLPGGEIRKKIGNSGKMFVAMDGEKVVGTYAVIVKSHSKLWFIRCNYGYLCFISILPDYRGNGVYKLLTETCESYASQKGLSVLMFDTNERNLKIQGLKKKEGFMLVSYKACKDHYNVIMAKWFNDCPYPLWYIKLRFQLSKLYVKARYKMVPGKGRVKRFGI